MTVQPMQIAQIALAHILVRVDRVTVETGRIVFLLMVRVQNSPTG